MQVAGLLLVVIVLFMHDNNIYRYRPQANSSLTLKPNESAPIHNKR